MYHLSLILWYSSSLVGTTSTINGRLFYLGRITNSLDTGTLMVALMVGNIATLG
jgi:hypothetical protein